MNANIRESTTRTRESYGSYMTRERKRTRTFDA
jgi:hypothetical protein